ncbi:AI-2E family transporter [Lapillicoccus jejuensis]|uniref:Putative PurR-regulated permease PerM n=1 Tax=Lapillicoccus jejuensis TaxID=402171 RepID=A0A542E2T7_9MICO|nr:AI-2E family transporter [Lapillicoccus jejuensis]TQJ09643.1 putative PurR-regulated permease PerM [Lapillicoccus jejuensis]
MLGRWSDLRRRQRVRLAAGAPTRLAHPPVEPPETSPEPAGPDLLHDLLPREEETEPEPARDAVREPAPPAPRPSGPPQRDFGPAGRPLNRQSPFYVGFVGAIGVLTAYGLWRLVSSLGTVFTLLTTAFFLALALDPLVAFLTRHRLRRGGAVATVFAGVVLVFVLLGFVVVPPVTTQASALVTAAPSLLEQTLTLSWVQDLDQHYQVISRLQAELNARLTDSAFLSQVAGGLLGAGQAIVTGVFETLTVLVLTLYFLASLPALKQAAYAVVPASRRPRVISLSEEIMRRVGIYAVSQVAVAGFNAFCAWIMMSLVGIPYAAVLAVCVGFLGLVPMVGATLGALLVAVVAVFDSPTKAVIALVYFIVYQQLENYLLAPRIMRRTVSVPGAVTVVAALTGGTLLGMVGALIAIPAAAGLLLLYDEVLVPRQRRH